MQNFYQDIPCIYFCVSDEGIIIRTNESLCRALGYGADELTGSKLESIFTLSTRIFQQTHFFPLLKLKGHAEEIYITLRCKNDDELPVLINAARKESNGSTLLHFAGIAVNKRKKFEDEIIAAKKTAESALLENTTLKAAKEQLQKHAEELDTQMALSNLRNGELKQFNHFATHTVREPLRKVLFYSSRILEHEEKATTAADLQKIRMAARDMDAKLKGLQHYVWLTNVELKKEKVDLKQVAQLVLCEIEAENPGVIIRFESDKISLLEADREQMVLLFKEVLANAVRFRKPGNIAEIKLESDTLLMNQFRELPGKYTYTEFIKLRIRDQGIGLDKDYREQAFELFRKLHSSEGAGIGLSLCRKIAENHGGSVFIESEKDIGTTVFILLPLMPKTIVG